MHSRNPVSAYEERGNVFERSTLEYDKNAQNTRPVEMLKNGYGCLDFILAIALPADPRSRSDIKFPQQHHILIYKTEPKGAIGDASTRLILYTKIGQPFVLDITAVKSVVGRRQTGRTESGSS
ncbi:hypothetical protein RhiJN_21521 [Ceratobasidium sp. AG-Ba]|nr:hypothetical protein RhiJN_21521 [Ceratobasidium sp. AG-Ba]